MAANKADADVLSVQEEIAQLLDKDMPEGDPSDQKFLKQVVAVFGDKKKVSDADWDSLSDDVQQWVTAAADAAADKKPLPAFPGVEAAETEDGPEPEPKKTKKESKKAAKKEAAEVEVEEVAGEEEGEGEQEEDETVVASGESTSEDLNDETQGKESEVATSKNKRGTKAAKTAKAKEAKPQKRAAATEPEAKSAKKAAGNGKAAGKVKGNGHARGASGVDTVFELAVRNPKASVESVIEKAKAAGVKTSETQIGTLYHLAHKVIDIGVKLGKFEA